MLHRSTNTTWDLSAALNYFYVSSRVISHVTETRACHIWPSLPLRLHVHKGEGQPSASHRIYQPSPRTPGCNVLYSRRLCLNSLSFHLGIPEFWPTFLGHHCLRLLRKSGLKIIAKYVLLRDSALQDRAPVPRLACSQS